MKPEDKERLRKSFKKALEHSVTADMPIEGHFDKDGAPMTTRKLVERELQTEKFYNKVDEAIDSGRITLDGFIRKVGGLVYDPRFFK